LDRAQTLVTWLRRERLAAGLALLTCALAVVDPHGARDHLRWLDLPTLAGLAGLLALSQGVRRSGYVETFARRMLARLHTARAMALALVTLAALLSMVLTNDVSLFLVVPLTISLAEAAPLPRARLVILEALAVNAGSMLSPIGNPQNLLLWRRSGATMAHFVAQMAPAFFVVSALVLVATLMLIPGDRIGVLAPPRAVTSERRTLAIASSLGLAVFVVLLQLHLAVLGAIGVLGAFAIARPGLLREVDWALLVTFAFMFLGLGHAAELGLTRHALAALDGSRPAAVYVGGIALSQVMSNVPATVVLAPAVAQPLLLAVAVNVGGFGTALGSLANLIAIRLEGGRHTMRAFHAISLPFLAVAAVAVWLALVGLGVTGTG